MYLYLLPLSTSLASESLIPTPTSDGGIEHTAASFAPCATWLSQARRNEIILFPPQFYLLHLLSPFLSPPAASNSELQEQRDKILHFLKNDSSGGNDIPWAEKAMSPTGLFFRKRDGRSVLGLDKPGPELKGSERGGDAERVVLVRFSKEGPRDVEVRGRAEVLKEEREKQGGKL